MVATVSEQAFEQWAETRGVECRRIREARAQGHKRPDYAIKVQFHWCFVEIKEIGQTAADLALLSDTQAGRPSVRWIDPGARLRQSIKDAAKQLRKFSCRGFPTVVCFFDTTIGFYLERVHIEQAMFGQTTLHFAVSPEPTHEPRFLGFRHGKKATLNSQANTSISAAAVLRQPFGQGLVVDLYHNPYARVPIPHHLSLPLVRKQYGQGLDDPDRQEPNVLDLMQSDEWQEWQEDREGKFERVIQQYLREFPAGQQQ